MANNPPVTVTQLNHSLTLRTDNGLTIGAVNGWNPTQNRTITAVYGFGTFEQPGPYGAQSGEPYEKCPGNIGGQTIGVTRYDLYTRKMEQAFGTPDLTMLSNQQVAFEAREFWRFPDNTIEVFAYQGCWFSNLGRNHAATGDRIVNVNATLEYVAKRQLQ
jgi:hypothetical protein